jgi:hypothetical protein
MKMANRKLLMGVVAVAMATAALGSSPARAAEFRFGHGDWHRGHWVHDRHGGRLGWWWVVGPVWHYYSRPHSFVVVEQAPPVIVEQAPPATPVTVVQPAPAPAPSPVLYYCKATGTHYPETLHCPGAWLVMTAETPPQPQQ